MNLHDKKQWLDRHGTFHDHYGLPSHGERLVWSAGTTEWLGVVFDITAASMNSTMLLLFDSVEKHLFELTKNDDTTTVSMYIEVANMAIPMYDH